MSMDRHFFLAVLLALATVQVAAAADPVIDFVFLGHADFERYRTYAWRQGTPAKDPAVERRIREAIDRVLARKGWRQVDGEADLYLRTAVTSLSAMSIASLRLEVVDGASQKPALRAMATGVFAGKREKLPKTIDKTVKKLLKQFPEAAGP